MLAWTQVFKTLVTRGTFSNQYHSLDNGWRTASEWEQISQELAWLNAPLLPRKSRRTCQTFKHNTQFNCRKPIKSKPNQTTVKAKPNEAISESLWKLVLSPIYNSNSNLISPWQLCHTFLRSFCKSGMNFDIIVAAPIITWGTTLTSMMKP